MTDEELRGFRRGDPAVFRTLVERHSPTLLRLLQGFAASAAGAEDLAQEVWVRAFRKREDYSGRGSFSGWLVAIARNVGRHEARRADRGAPPAPSYIHEPIDPGPGPAGQTAIAELKRSVQRALLELPDRQREVVVLRMIEGLSTREAASALDCAEGTVKASLHAGLKKLSQHLEAWK